MLFTVCFASRLSVLWLFCLLASVVETAVIAGQIFTRKYLGTWDVTGFSNTSNTIAQNAYRWYISVYPFDI